MSVQKVIFPGLFIGILSVIFLTSQMLASPGKLKTVNIKPVQARAQQAGQPVTGCTISSAYPDAVLQWCSLIEQYASENGLDPNLVSAVMLQESAGQPDAYSKSGAVGLMQVMPRDGKASSFVCKNGPCFATRPSMQELFDPDFNVSYGSRMLADLIQHYGSQREALKAYGPKDVGYYYADLVIGIMDTHP
jgi:soluble lytic murein transglycosylase-like protein